MTEQEFSIKINPDNWAYMDSIEFGSCIREGRTTRSYELADMLLIEWTYPIPVEGGMKALPDIIEANKVLSTILDMIRAYGEDMDFSDVVVNLRKWNLMKFLEFDEAKQKGKWSKVETMMKEVCQLRGVTSDSPLSFTQGAKMMNAIMKAYSDSMSGKN